MEKDIIFRFQHIICDLQNLDVLLDKIYEESYLSIYNYLSHFVDYSVFTFRMFMENKRYFGSALLCECYKCKTIYYDDVAQNVQDISKNIKASIGDISDLKFNYDESTIQDRTYIKRLLAFCEYFSDEFQNITKNMSN